MAAGDAGGQPRRQLLGGKGAQKWNAHRLHWWWRGEDRLQGYGDAWVVGWDRAVIILPT